VTASLWFVARAQIRRRWRALVALTVFVGVLGGIAISLVAGSRRSSSVVERYLAAGVPYDLLVFAPWLTQEDVLAIPGVERVDISAYVGLTLVGSDGTAADGVDGLATDWSSLDPTFRILDGAAPDRSDPNQVLVNEPFVQKFGLTTGDRLDVQMFGLDQYEQVSTGDYRPTGPHYELEIAGVVRTPYDIAVDVVEKVDGSANGGVLISGDFYRDHRAEFLDFGAAFDVLLAPGTDRDAFRAALRDTAPAGEPAPSIGPPRFSDRRESLEAPANLETAALLLLGVGVAVAAAAATGLLLRAEQRFHDDDGPRLAALGVTASQRGTIAMARSLTVAAGGAVLAVAVAVALSGRYPVGIGRQLELDAGVDLNVAVLALGALLIAAVVVFLAFLLGRRVSAPRRLPTRRATLAHHLARAGVPTDVVLGTRLAFPAGAAIAAGAASLAIVAAVGGYVGGVDHLYDEPSARGWPWDAVIGNVNFQLADDTAARLADDPRIEALTLARYCQVSLDGRAVEVLAIDPAGTAPPTVTSGRLPVTAREIGLGAPLADQLGVDAGDDVAFSVADGECVSDATPANDLALTVVGTVRAPVLGESELGEVAVVTIDALADAGGDATLQLVLAKFAGDDPAATAVELDRELSEEMMTDSIPARIVTLHRVRDLPMIGLLLAGAMGSIVLAYSLATGVRRRMRELAVLRAFGMRTRRVGRVLTWQGVALALATLSVGVPIGLVAASVLWRNVATDLGVSVNLVIAPWLFAVPVLVLIVAIAASWSPARRARRQRVAAILRVE